MPDIRLIDANALLQECEKAYKFEDRRGQLAHCISAIKTSPTIDAQPVKQGNWNVTGEYFDKEEHEEKIDFQCSKCSMIYTLTKNRAMPNYCEHCGSKNVR